MQLRYLFTITSIIFLLGACYSTSGFSQNTTKAEIKKPQLSLVGQWSAEMEIIAGKKKPINSDYAYNFLQNGRYNAYYLYKDSSNKLVCYWLNETGKWSLKENNRKLILEPENIIAPNNGSPFNRPSQVCDLGKVELFHQPNSTTFSIKRASGTDTVEYIFFRKNYKYMK